MPDHLPTSEGTGSTGSRSKYLVFEVAGQRFALDLPVVQELARAVSVVPLPRAPAVVEGVIDVRGTLVPVLDLRGRFGLPASPLRPSDHLVLARAADRLVALRCDRAEGIVSLPAGEVEDARRAVPEAGYVAGVVRLPDGLVLVHDLRTFLSGAEGAALDDSLAAARADDAGEPEGAA